MTNEIMTISELTTLLSRKNEKKEEKELKVSTNTNVNNIRWYRTCKQQSHEMHNFGLTLQRLNQANIAPLVNFGLKKDLRNNRFASIQ